MIKPDGVSRGLIGEIIKRYEQKSLHLSRIKFINADRELAEKHYMQHKGKDFYEKLVEFITSGTVLAMVVQGENVIQIIRKLNGATRVEDALPGSIRGDYATSTTMNVIHCSDSVETAEKEIELWFGSSTETAGRH